MSKIRASDIVTALSLDEKGAVTAARTGPRFGDTPQHSLAPASLTSQLASSAVLASATPELALSDVATYQTTPYTTGSVIAQLAAQEASLLWIVAPVAAVAAELGRSTDSRDGPSETSVIHSEDEGDGDEESEESGEPADVEAQGAHRGRSDSPSTPVPGAVAPPARPLLGRGQAPSTSGPRSVGPTGLADIHARRPLQVAASRSQVARALRRYPRAWQPALAAVGEALARAQGDRVLLEVVRDVQRQLLSTGGVSGGLSEDVAAALSTSSALCVWRAVRLLLYLLRRGHEAALDDRARSAHGEGRGAFV